MGDFATDINHSSLIARVGLESPVRVVLRLERVEEVVVRRTTLFRLMTRLITTCCVALASLVVRLELHLPRAHRACRSADEPAAAATAASVSLYSLNWWCVCLQTAFKRRANSDGDALHFPRTK